MRFHNLLLLGIVCCLIEQSVVSQTIDVSGVNVTVSATPSTQVVAVSSSMKTYWGSFAVTGNYTGSPVYDTAELTPVATEWRMTYSDDGASTEMIQFNADGTYVMSNGKVTWGSPITDWVPLNSRTVRGSSTSVKSDGYNLAFTMSVRFKYKNKTTDEFEYSDEISVSVDTVLWVVGVSEIQYSIDGGTTYTAMPDNIPFPLGQGVQFKVIKNPTASPAWPSNFPEFTLPSGVTGIGEVTSYGNHTPNNSSNPGPYTIKFSCGGSILIKRFYTINVARLEYLATTAPGATTYLEYPKRDSEYGSGYYLWLPKCNGVLLSQAVNSMETNSLWPGVPNQKPVWTNAVITDSSIPWRGTTNRMSLPSGAITVVSAECGNILPTDILVVDLNTLTVTDASDATNKKIAKPNDQTLYVVQDTNNNAVINTSLAYFAPAAPPGVPACTLLKWSILGQTGTFSTASNPSSLTSNWTSAMAREFIVKAWLDGVPETDDTIRKIDVVVAKIEAELEKKWGATWGAVTNKTGTYPTGTTKAGRKWYVLWDCHQNRIKPVIQPASMVSKVSSVSWSGITTSAQTGLWRNITNQSGVFMDVVPTLTMDNGDNVTGKIKTDIAVTGVQEVKWISNATASAQNRSVVSSSGQQETKPFRLAKVAGDVIAGRKKVYPEKSAPTDTAPFNVAELNATLTQAIPSGMNVSLKFYVKDNTNARPGNTTDIIITRGANFGATTIEPEITNLNVLTGSTVGRTYVTFATPAHAGDDYIGVAHPESGLAITVNASTKAQVGTTTLPDEYQSKLLTVWRTLWLERDRMLAPTLPTSAGTSSDGFNYSDYPTKWDTTEPSSEHSEFDLAVRPPNLNPALLTAQLELACVTVVDAPLATWGITQHEPVFQHNATTPVQSFDVGNNNNNTEFWVLYALSAYESDSSRDYDPNGESRSTLGSSGGFVRVFCETVRDCRKNSGNANFSYDLVLQRELTHEILHCFLGVHTFIGNVQDPNNIANQGIMAQGTAFTSTPAAYSLNADQIKAIQANNNPKPL